MISYAECSIRLKEPLFFNGIKCVPCINFMFKGQYLYGTIKNIGDDNLYVCFPKIVVKYNTNRMHMIDEICDQYIQAIKEVGYKEEEYDKLYRSLQIQLRTSGSFNEIIR